ncbi:DNA-protecting protein DprA [Rhodoferax sp. 4810]|uniref:DNA-protecting protein DprA n=1 Tax=Thiospirillum jenense TaxID=1653858 RepID=A0A839HEM5_9GAMM|nr:DNA-processing protein DprA [Thiospirillum jenense]MBB1075849.1 DNA-protecting protein DprA [Rhodoferax jenense]MBB1126924.1 DNA-protecting protein DprA [Thiospirillum jenense]
MTTAIDPAANRELHALLALLQIPGLGPLRIDRLITHTGSAVAALDADQTACQACGLSAAIGTALQQPDWHGVERIVQWATRPQAWIMTRYDARYPPLLREIHAPPPVLFGVGDPDALREPQLAMVGTRNPTPSAVETTYAFARHLAGLGIVIASGLAQGIDTAAHQGALRGGKTIAVLGTGPDRIYPKSNHALAHQIVEHGGALVSEFLPGTGPQREHFPRRNRLISGLSLGTFVTEAGVQSGALITARYAVEQGREVFALPGSIHNPLARGCHALIRDGAKLIDCIEQLLDELLPQLNRALLPIDLTPPSDALDTVTATTAPSLIELPAAERQLLDLLDNSPTAPDELIQRSGWAADAVISTLLLLELRGHVLSHPGGRYSRR